MQNLEGLKLGRFHIEKLLGIGGFAVVYRVLDPNIKDHAAIKLLARDWLRSKREVKRFLREGAILESMQHPNLPVLYEQGQIYGQPYHLMELCVGETLASLLLTLGPPKIEAMALKQILMQTASALDYLHHHGMIHRDVKPANIIVSPDRTAKLLDLGLAENVLASGMRDRDFAGTPRYMAPEQRAGRDARPESDIYSLGVTAGEVLRWAGYHVSARVHQLILDATHPDPKRRPSSASQFVWDLMSEVT